MSYRVAAYPRPEELTAEQTARVNAIFADYHRRGISFAKKSDPAVLAGVRRRVLADPDAGRELLKPPDPDPTRKAGL